MSVDDAAQSGVLCNDSLDHVQVSQVLTSGGNLSQSLLRALNVF
jgi:hypothetical protein